MGTAKKESSRRERQSKPNDNKMSNVKTKGENFYRSAKRVKTLNMYKDAGPTRNARGDITKEAPFQSRTTAPNARVEPHRKWFTNTRVISQDALDKFRGAVEERAKDPYSYLLKQNKLPMSLIRDTKDKERKDGVVQHAAKRRVETETFGETFGPKSRRKRVRLDVGSLEEMGTAAQRVHAERGEEEGVEDVNDRSTPDEQQDGSTSTAREPFFSKGQSKRIWNELYKVIDSSDVVIHVLDARDPLGTRCRSVEKYIKEEAPHKHLLFLLNKCDLVPSGVAAKWVRLLQTEYPTLAFHASLTNSFGKGTLISLLRQFSSLHSSRKQISVGFIGYPNTGKSSIINTLRKKKVCKTAPIPGETKVWQYITLMKRIYLIDCPGIVPPSMADSPEDILLRGVVRVENVENPAQYIPAVLAKCKRHHLERTYDVRGWSSPASTSASATTTDTAGAGEDNIVGTPQSDKQKTEEAIRFLEALARKGGRLLKGGEADLDGVAKMVLNDFLRGKVPWFVPPPTTATEVGTEVETEVGREGLEAVDAVGDVAEIGGEAGETVDERVEVEGREDGSEFEEFGEDGDEDSAGSESGEDEDEEDEDDREVGGV